MKKAKPVDWNVTPKDKDLPATQGMLYLVRSEVKADVRELRSEMKAGFKEVDARFNEVDASLALMRASIEKMASEMSRFGVLMEEQNSRNHIVLEGMSGLWTRQERVETRVDGFENFLKSLPRRG